MAGTSHICRFIYICPALQNTSSVKPELSSNVERKINSFENNEKPYWTAGKSHESCVHVFALMIFLPRGRVHGWQLIRTFSFSLALPVLSLSIKWSEFLLPAHSFYTRDGAGGVCAILSIRHFGTCSAQLLIRIWMWGRIRIGIRICSLLWRNWDAVEINSADLTDFGVPRSKANCPRIQTKRFY